MATLRWKGGARKTAQVRSGTITGYDATSTYKITIGVRVISTVGTGGTANTTAVALVALLNASTLQEFAEITWTAPGAGVITGTSDTAGKAFTFTLTVTGGAGTISAAANSTVNTGPNDLSSAENYDTGALPVNGDTLEFVDTDWDVLWNLDALTGVTLAALRIRRSFTGTNTNRHGWIGLPEINIDDTSLPYPEYRPRKMAVNATIVDIGHGPGNGSGRCYLDLQAAQSAVTVAFAAAPPSDTINQEAVQLLGTHAANTLDVKAGTVGVATQSGEVSTFLTIQTFGDASLRMGSGVTWTTLTHNSTGQCRVNSAGATLTLGLDAGDNGTVLCEGSGGITATCKINSGLLDYRSSGTIADLVVCSLGTADFALNEDGCTVSAIEVQIGGGFNDPNKKTTRTAGIDYRECGRHQCRINTGAHYRETQGAFA